MGRLIHLVEHTGGARRENLLQVVIIFDSYLFREKYFVFFAAAGERQGGELGSGVCVGHPRFSIFFFCLAHFPFLLSLVLIFPASQSLVFATNSRTRPLPLHKKNINDPKDSPPSLRCCNKRKSKVGFD